MSTLVLLVVALGGLVFGLLAFEAVVRNSVIAAALALGYLVIEYAAVPIPPLAFGGVSVYAHDVVFALIGAAAVARLLRARSTTGRSLTRWQQGLLLVAAIGLFSLLRGIGDHGLETAVNEARKWVFLLAAATYFTTVQPSRPVLDRIATWIVWAGSAVAGVALLRWVVIGLGVPVPALLGERVDHGLRVLHANETLLVLQAALILMVAWRGLGTRWRWVGAGLLTTVVLMQHRTVWGALAVGVAVVMWRDRELARRALVLLPVALVGAVAAAVVVLGSPADQVATSATNTQTFQWRFEGWRELVTSNGPEGALEAAVGRGFGTGWEREVFGETREESPHSLYLESYLRLGVIGTAAMLALMVLPIVRLWRRPLAAPLRGAPRQGLLSDDALISLLAAQATFGFTYFQSPSAGVVLGIAVGAALKRAAYRPGSGTEPSAVGSPMLGPVAPGAPVVSGVPASVGAGSAPASLVGARPRGVTTSRVPTLRR